MTATTVTFRFHVVLRETYAKSLVKVLKPLADKRLTMFISREWRTRGRGEKPGRFVVIVTIGPFRIGLTKSHTLWVSIVCNYLSILTLCISKHDLSRVRKYCYFRLGILITVATPI